MHELKSFLSKLSIIDSEGIPITEDSIHYNHFYGFLDSFCSSKAKTVLYRGTNRIDQYNANVFDVKSFAEKYFVLGSKSHHYEPGIHALFCIDDHSLELFEYIFDQLHKKLCYVKFGASGTVAAIKAFLKNNPVVFEFFTDENKKTEFIHTIDKLNDKEKELVKDYYLSLMHTVGKSLFPDSCFISTSKRLKTAMKFKNDGIVIVSWIPSGERNGQFIKYNDINKTDSFIRKIGLPFYEISLYREQKEVCVKGGLLPHFIIGYSFDDSFVVNPFLLSQIASPYDINDLIINGIDVDQSDFNEVLSTTLLRRFLCVEGYYYDY